MSRRFEPIVLKWAREKRFGPKIETLVENWGKSWTDVTPDLIRQWESGSGEPTFAEVKKLASIYKRPLAVFFLDDPPPEKGNPPDLRTIGSKDNKFLSPEALLVIRKARRIQEVSTNLYEKLDESPSFKYSRHSLAEDPSKLAERVRVDLSISMKDQATSKKYEDFFEYLRTKIESTGVITLKSGLQDSFPTEDCRAFSFADRLPYLILVNNKDGEGAKNFSLMHEFAHILLREAGICNNFRAFGPGRGGGNKLEVFCNQFAASFLVPREYFLGHPTLNGRSEIPTTELDNVANRLAFDFKVSRVVILRRLLSFGLISTIAYDAKTRAWDEEALPQRRKGGSFSLKAALHKNGRTFSSLVIEAYNKNKIPYSGVSDFLGLKTKHLPNFERLLNAHAG